MSYNQQNNSFDPYSSGASGYTDAEGSKTLLTKVFLVMFISLLAVGAVSYGLGAILLKTIVNEDLIGTGIFLIAMVVSAIGLLVLSFVIPRKMSNGFSSIMPAYVTYMIFMAILLSSLMISYDLSILSMSFGITAGVFGIMALLGYVSKGSLTGIGTLIFGLFIGAIALSLVNFFLQSDILYWGISFGVFAMILFITMYDVRRIKDIINSGYMSGNNNLVLYCSFILCTDFINIFIRVASYVARFSRRNWYNPY